MNTAPQTYVAFHLLFVLPPIVLLGGLLAANRPVRFQLREVASGIALLSAIAMVYTTPWDNYLIARGVWTYGPETVLSRIWLAPVEEYAFFVLQPVLAGLWFHWLGYAPKVEAPIGYRTRFAGVVIWIGVAAGGALALSVPGGLYLGAIAVWAAPIAALQWLLGGPVLWRNRWLLALSIGGPTLYLSAIDRIAIDIGIWRLSFVHITGIQVAGLPIEEGAFFFVTTTLVVQGLLLFHWVVARVQAGGRTYGLSGLLPLNRYRERENGPQRTRPSETKRSARPERDRNRDRDTATDDTEPGVQERLR